MRQRWSAVRAAILTCVLLVHGLQAAPLPHVVTRGDLKNPVAQEEVARWSERLTAMGWALSPEELAARVIEVTGVIGGTHREALAPFRPAFRWTGTGQGWGLFANPDIYPERVVVRVQRGGDWETIYRRLDPEAPWASDRLGYRRVRGVLESAGNGSRPSGLYRRLAERIADLAFASDPTVQRVEVSTHRTHTTLPGQPPDDEVVVRHVVVVDR